MRGMCVQGKRQREKYVAADSFCRGECWATLGIAVQLCERRNGPQTAQRGT